MKREVRPSRFQLDSAAGVPPPKHRRLVFISPFAVSMEPHQVSTVPPAQERQQKAPQQVARQVTAATGVGLAASSLRMQEDAKRKRLAHEWAIMAEDLRADSDILSSFPNKSGVSLAFLFEDRAAGTLAKHSHGWRKWLEFARASHINPGDPSSSAVLDFCDALSVGSLSDRGMQRVSAAKAVVQAMKFAGHKLGLQKLLACVDNPAIAAWLAQDKWKPSLCKEAIPLPLTVVACKIAMKMTAGSLAAYCS